MLKNKIAVFCVFVSLFSCNNETKTMKNNSIVIDQSIEPKKYLDEFANLVNSATINIKSDKFVEADSDLSKALLILDKLSSFKELLPKDFSIDDGRKKINDIKYIINDDVLLAFKKISLETYIDNVVSKIDINDCDSIFFGKYRIQSKSDKNEVKEILSKLESLQKDCPQKIDSIKEIKIKYSDLRNVKISTHGEVEASNYYNCIYDNRNIYRSFKISKNREHLNLYCKRSEENCEKLFDVLSTGGYADLNVMIKYPKNNYICEEDQAILLDYSVIK